MRNVFSINGADESNQFDDGIMTWVEMEDARYLPDPLPLKEYLLNKTHAGRFVKVYLDQNAWGGKGGLDYFDIVRINHEPFKLSDDATRRCTVKPRGGGCGSRPQHCSAPACAPDTIWWQTDTAPGLHNRGCSMVTGPQEKFKGTVVTRPHARFGDTAKCVKKETLETLTPPYIIDTSDPNAMADCTPWDAQEICDKKILSLIDNGPRELNGADIFTHLFKIHPDDCTDDRVKIEAVERVSMVPTGQFLSFVDVVNSTLHIGDDAQCLSVIHGLCGANSVSFQTPGNLFVTSCNGEIILKEEYDHCG